MALKAVGSSPISHPRKREKHRTVRAKARAYRSARTVSKRGVRADICTPGGAFFQTRLCAGGKTESTPRRADRKTESGCSAVGSARGLGACDRLMCRPPKARKISVFLAFSRFSATVFFGKKLLTTDLTTYGFDRKIEYFHPSGCGAAGSARSLGACDRLVSRPPKAREISVFLAFSRFFAAVCFGKKLLTTDLNTYGFDRKN